MADYRSIPSVDHLLQQAACERLATQYSTDLTTQAIREVLSQARTGLAAGSSVPDDEILLKAAEDRLIRWTAPTLLPVINATGVILHTNLGRAPLSPAAIRAVTETGQSYSTLEFNRETGKRGSRFQHAEDALTRLTGAEAALVVNNNAAAVLLALSAYARRRRVITAVSQLVEIGGGFRVPDVLKQSGAHLVSVGTTNRVRLSDYEDALQEPAAAVLFTHPSNYKMVGFTEQPGLNEISAVAHAHHTLVIADLGSGALLDTARFGLEHEPTVMEAISAGADLVCFSGDKLLGGPQSGLIVGNQEEVEKLKHHPLARAIRVDKLCLAALSATLQSYLTGRAEREIPVWRMIAARSETLRLRADVWQKALGQGEVVSGQSTVGGGSLPGEILPTWLLALGIPRPDQFLHHLLAQPIPVIARISEKRVVFDPRTILAEQEDLFLKELSSGLLP